MKSHYTLTDYADACNKLRQDTRPYFSPLPRRARALHHYLQELKLPWSEIHKIILDNPPPINTPIGQLHFINGNWEPERIQ